MKIWRGFTFTNFSAKIREREMAGESMRKKWCLDDLNIPPVIK
jgi:hypothetical protein